MKWKIHGHLHKIPAVVSLSSVLVFHFYARIPSVQQQIFGTNYTFIYT